MNVFLDLILLHSKFKIKSVVTTYTKKKKKPYKRLIYNYIRIYIL